MKESKDMIRKEVAFMKKKGAPKSMIRHETREAKEMGVKMAKGGSFRSSADGVAKKGKTKCKPIKMAMGGMAKGGMAKGGMAKGCK